MAAKVRFDESEDIVDICYDNVFKAVFTKGTPDSQGALSGFVSAAIGRNVEILSVLANEPPIENMRDRQLRFDINCRADNGELVNVEMSLDPDICEPVRIEFHAAKMFVGQDIRGAEKSYGDLKQTYQVAILVKGRFFDDRDFFHSFEYYDPIRGVSLGGRTRIVTLELSKLDGVAGKPIGEMSNPELWAVFFRYLNDPSMRGKINEILEREEGIAMAGKMLLTISRDEEERARIMNIEKSELDWQSKMVEAKRAGRRELQEDLLRLLDGDKNHTMEDIRKMLAGR